jgi:hypothetical protein
VQWSSAKKLSTTSGPWAIMLPTKTCKTLQNHGYLVGKSRLRLCNACKEIKAHAYCAGLAPCCQATHIRQVIAGAVETVWSQIRILDIDARLKSRQSPTVSRHTQLNNLVGATLQFLCMRTSIHASRADLLITPCRILVRHTLLFFSYSLLKIDNLHRSEWRYAS